MKNPVQFTKAIARVRYLLRHSPWRRDLVILLVLACSALLPTARAACEEGCDPNLNTFLGEDALFTLTTGTGNTAIGWQALHDNTTGGGNTASGFTALHDNTTGAGNTATGDGALYSNDTGNSNTAIGANALLLNIAGDDNTASGAFSLASNISGVDNTAIGFNALYSNEEGSFNTGNGVNTLYQNRTGGNNTASGWAALLSNTIGNNNTAQGLQALYSNNSGNDNTAVGLNALFANTIGSSNIALGSGAGGNLTTGSNNIDIGNGGVAGESAKIRIGKKEIHKNTYVAGIYGVTVARGIGVIIDSSGHLGTTASSSRFKDKIQPMDRASEAILALQPVTFRYKKELDPEGCPQFGLVAEEVAEVNPDLVAFDEQGKPYTVRYEAVNAMLLNEFLKAHRKVEVQETIIGELKTTTAKQTAMLARQEQAIATLTSQLQKVSARVEAQQAVPRLASE